MNLKIPDELVAELAKQVANQLQPQARPPYLNVDDAAAYLACDRKRIYDLKAAGKLTPHRDGRRLLFTTADLDAVLDRDA